MSCPFAGYYLTNRLRLKKWCRYAATWLLAISVLVTCGSGAVLTVEAQDDLNNGIFSDLTPTHDGGVAHPTDGSTGNALQQTLIDAYFWRLAHNGAKATVIAASGYPVSGSKILIPGGVRLKCSSYSPQTYTGGCAVYQTDPGDGTATGGSPLLMVDFSVGVLADRKTKCSLFDVPPQPGCIIIDSSGASLAGITLFGMGTGAGGSDVGIRVAADGVDVEDTAIGGFFGGPGIQHVVGVNANYAWNYGTNVNTWWCNNPLELTSANLQKALLIEDGKLGGMNLDLVDGNAGYNQYSTGCAFASGYRVGAEYPIMMAIHVTGSGSKIHDNLPQVDGIGLDVGGSQQTVSTNSIEYSGRIGLFTDAANSTFDSNSVISGCIDPNLADLWPGSLDQGIPLYPSVPTFLHRGTVIMDLNGNVERVVNDGGTTDVEEPNWPDGGGTVSGTEILWQNIGPWKPGLTASTDPGTALALTSGLCYPVVDVGQNNVWLGTQVGEDAGVNGPSYERGAYLIADPAALSGNACDRDQPDSFGNGQCWWGGDEFSNGGPPYLTPNGKTISAAGGGTAWVGDYSILMLTDGSPQHYNDFQGMSKGQIFWVTSNQSPNIIDPWGVNGSGSLYGHPSIWTCGGKPLVVAPNMFYQFVYNLDNPWAVTQLNCPDAAVPVQNPSVTLSAASLAFAPQGVGSASPSQSITLLNSGSGPLNLSVGITGGFSQTNNCGTSIAGGASCLVEVISTPTTVGSNTGTLSFTDNANGSPQTVALSGNGEGLLVSAASGMLVLSTSATTTISVMAQGGFIGSVALSCQVAYVGPGTPAAMPACSLAPGVVQVDGPSAGSTSLTVSLAQTNKTASSGVRERQWGGRGPLRGLAAMCLPLIVWVRKRALVCLYAIFLLSVVGFEIGCGFSSSHPAASTSSTVPVITGSYQVTVIATGGTIQASTVIKVIAQ